MLTCGLFKSPRKQLKWLRFNQRSINSSTSCPCSSASFGDTIIAEHFSIRCWVGQSLTSTWESFRSLRFEAVDLWRNVERSATSCQAGTSVTYLLFATVSIQLYTFLITVIHVHMIKGFNDSFRALVLWSQHLHTIHICVKQTFMCF